jgi:hypothetical protein
VKFHEDGTLPTDNEVFVFGSNLAGIHGAGAARVALDNYGAILGIGSGFMGNSYAIPTKDEDIETMSLEHIYPFIDAFIQFATSSPEFSFFVTGVGCGLAGYDPSDVAPMFHNAPDNCSFPDTWRKYLS